MNIIITKNYDEMSEKAYELVKKILLEKENATLGFATGSTPVGLYKNMINDYKKGIISYKKVKSCNLDEYVGLGEGDEQSYVEFMHNNLFHHIDIDLQNTYLPNGKVGNEQACAYYNELLKNAEIDVQILGIGGNGHIAFNEPGTPFDSVTHIIELTAETISDNARFFASIDDVPTKAITMGIANIMAAKSIIILASGKNKADAVYCAIKGEINTICPASILRTHENVTFIVDEDAASKIN